MTARLRRTTVATGLADALREEILTGALPEGLVLRQEAVAQRYDVSRIPVREALRLLEAEGLVVLRPHRGAVVAGLSLAEIEEIFDLRAVLEPMLLSRAIPELTEEDLAAAEAILGAYETALDAGDVAQWGVMNWAFHAKLYERAGRPQTLAFLGGLRQKADRYTRLQLRFAGDVDRARREHRALLQLCARGDVDAAAALARDHVQAAGGALLDYLRRRPA